MISQGWTSGLTIGHEKFKRPSADKLKSVARTANANILERYSADGRGPGEAFWVAGCHIISGLAESCMRLYQMPPTCQTMAYERETSTLALLSPRAMGPRQIATRLSNSDRPASVLPANAT